MWNLRMFRKLTRVWPERRRREKGGTVSDWQVHDLAAAWWPFYPYPKSHAGSWEGFEQRFNSWLTVIRFCIAEGWIDLSGSGWKLGDWQMARVSFSFSLEQLGLWMPECQRFRHPGLYPLVWQHHSVALGKPFPILCLRFSCKMR